MDSMEASRQIMWMIPFWMKVVMYLSLAVATYFFFQGLVAKYKFITAGKDPKQVLPPKLNIQNFLVTIFFQGKVPRDGFVNVYHSMIFWGFLTHFLSQKGTPPPFICSEVQTCRANLMVYCYSNFNSILLKMNRLSPKDG